MSRLSVYVGAYVQAPLVARELAVPGAPRCRVDPSHQNPKGARFCSHCGASVEIPMPTTHRVERYLGPGECADEWTDSMVMLPDGTGKVGGKWMPNHHGIGTWDSDRSMSGMEISPQEIEQAKARLLQRYADFIAHMEARHKVRLETQYGVVAYCF